MTRKPHLALCLSLVLTSAVFAQQAAQRQTAAQTQQDLQAEYAAENIFKVYFPNLEMARKAAITFHHAVLESRYNEGYLVMELDAQEMSQLQSFGFRLARADEFITQRRAFLDQANRASISGQSSGLVLGGGATTQAITGFSCY